MAYTRTFAQLSLAVQQLGQWENSGDITPAILLQAINYGLLEGYDAMVQKWADYYTANVDFAITTATDTYALSTIASAFYKLRHLDYSSDAFPVGANARFRRMLPFDIEAQHTYSGAVSSTSRTPRYRMQAGNLIIAPKASGTVRAWYIPTATQFTGVGDVSTLAQFDAPVEERLVVQIAQRDLLERNDLPTNDCDMKIARLTALLKTAADSRDAAEPFYLDPSGPPRDRMWPLDDEDFV